MGDWRKIRFQKLTVLIHGVREPLRWRWYRVPGKTRLMLITPRGVLWDFKMSGGTWIRKTTLTVKEPKP